MTIVIWVLVVLIVLGIFGQSSFSRRLYKVEKELDGLKEPKINKEWDWRSGPDPKWVKNHQSDECVSEYTSAILTGDKYFKYYKSFCPKLYQIKGFGASEIEPLERVKPDAVIIDVLSTNSSEMGFFDLLRGSEMLKKVPVFVLVNNEKEKAVFEEKISKKDHVFMKPYENLFGKIKSALKAPLV